MTCSDRPWRGRSAGCSSVPWSSAAWLSKVSWPLVFPSSRSPWPPSRHGWDADDRDPEGGVASAGPVASAAARGQGVDRVDGVHGHRPPRPLPAAGPGRAGRADTHGSHPLLAGQGPRPQPGRRHPGAHPRRAGRTRPRAPRGAPGRAAPAGAGRARPAGGLATPALAMVYGAAEGSDDPQAPGGAAYVVNEWIDGETLAERLASGPMPEREVRTVLRRLTEGVAEAHRVGLAVGGLTPGNVVLRPNGPGCLRAVPAATGTIDVGDAALGSLLEACLTGLDPADPLPRPLSGPSDLLESFSRALFTEP